MLTYKIELKLVRSFGLGVTILSPKINGLCLSFQLGCLVLQIWSRGLGGFKFNNYWSAFG